MSEKPEKRLVSKGRYAFLLGKSASLTFLSMTSDIVAILLLLMTVVQLVGVFYIWPIVTGLVTAGLSVVFFRAAGKLSKKANEIDHIQPITARNTCLLPPEESLVRASDVPLSQQQAELLRATQHGNETPAEELLRASTDGQDT
jgi:hypothetical protein